MHRITIPITQNGFNKIMEELSNLEKIERPKVIEAIRSARALGDLSENAEYKAAKEKQASLDSRISYLNRRVPLLQVIEFSNNNTDVIRFGAKVSLLDLNNDTKVLYILVGEDESDPNEGKISIRSPLGAALLGKSKSDLCEVKTPGGTKEYEIQNIQYEKII